MPLRPEYYEDPHYRMGHELGNIIIKGWGQEALNQFTREVSLLDVDDSLAVVKFFHSQLNDQPEGVLNKFMCRRSYVKESQENQSLQEIAGRAQD